MRIAEITIRRLSLPLVKPYRRSYRVDRSFEPVLVQVRDRGGGGGWGEAVITPGYTHETPETSWTFLREQAAALVGRDAAEAKDGLLGHVEDFPNAVSAAVTALEMMERSPHLAVDAAARIPLLQGLDARTPDDVPDEVEAILGQGFDTIKLKVGGDVDADLALVRAVQRAVDGRALIRIDANRGFGRDDGHRFAASLDAEGIMLFEQPCADDDWEANAAVAAVSRVPVMLDESIYRLADVERAAKVPGVGFVKLKLKKAGALDRLHDGLVRIRELGMTPVLGDGVATDVSCWMEACVARSAIDNAGEMNGFLRLRTRLLREPLAFEGGAIVLAAGYRPELNDDAVSGHTVVSERFAEPVVAARPSGA
jgi:L-alanine-DL-glutamate epimerase-like enolase superfamily enzyme